MTDATWEFEKLRMEVLREQYANGDMDEGVLRERLKLMGFVEPWLGAEIKHCNELRGGIGRFKWPVSENQHGG